MWHAALALLFLSPIVGKMISGSTPPLLFVQRLKWRLARQAQSEVTPLPAEFAAPLA
jgi:hypothetical protein